MDYEIIPEDPDNGRGSGRKAAGAEAIVEQGGVLQKMENDSMLAVSIQRPRNEKAVLEGALAELSMTDDAAAQATYSLPYRNQIKGTKRVRLTLVEGPSIHAATSLARRWGNCSIAARPISETDKSIEMEGVFLDMETNFRVSRTQRVAKVGKYGALKSERLQKDIGAGGSKAMRNAILIGLPAWLKDKYVQTAREKVAGGPLDDPADPKKVKGVCKGFSRMGVDVAHLEEYIGRAVKDWRGTEIANLTALGVAIKDEILTVREAFDLRATPVAAQEQPEEGQAAPSDDEAEPADAADALPVAEATPRTGNGQAKGTRFSGSRQPLEPAPEAAPDPGSALPLSEAQIGFMLLAGQKVGLDSDGIDQLIVDQFAHLGWGSLTDATRGRLGEVKAAIMAYKPDADAELDDDEGEDE